METLGDILKEMLLRIVVAIIPFAIGAYLFHSTDNPLYGLMFSLPFVVGCIIIIMPPVQDLLARPFVGLYSPGGRNKKPLPVYSVPQSKRSKGLYEEAIADYEKIITEFPQELNAYIEMINVMVVNLKDRTRAEFLLERALGKLRKEEDRTVLKNVFNNVVTLLQSGPEWEKPYDERQLSAQAIDNTIPVEEPDGITKKRFHSGHLRIRKRDDHPSET